MPQFDDFQTRLLIEQSKQTDHLRAIRIYVACTFFLLLIPIGLFCLSILGAMMSIGSG